MIGRIAAIAVLLMLAGMVAPGRSDDLSDWFKDCRGGCFVMLDVNRGTYLRHDDRRCATRFSPCSTFKIPNSLIGLETGVIPDADHVIEWDGRERPRAVTNRDHTLRTAFEHSVVWYYQELARRVGTQRMQHFVSTIPYGNQDLSGGLAQFWLGSSLTISADEQVAFLHRLMDDDLSFAHRSMEIVRDLMVLEGEGADVYRGKTGSHRGDDGDDLGWFVGVVTRGDDQYIFACNVEGDGTFGSTAKRICEAILADRGLLPRKVRR